MNLLLSARFILERLSLFILIHIFKNFVSYYEKTLNNKRKEYEADIVVCNNCHHKNLKSVSIDGKCIECQNDLNEVIKKDT